MGFFRVRVRKTLEYQIRVFANSQIEAEDKAIVFDTAPSGEIVRTVLVDGFPTYSVLNAAIITDPDNSLSKLYAKNLANEAQESLELISNNLSSQISSDEFYLLKEKITDLESTIQVILS